MSRFALHGNYKNQKGEVNLVNLILVHFVDETKTHFIYAPQLDLAGYGKNITEAKNAFHTTLADFFDYTLKKKTVALALAELGWTKKAKKLIAPDTQSVFTKNDYVSSIFDKYQTKTYHEKVGIPVFA